MLNTYLTQLVAMSRSSRPGPPGWAFSSMEHFVLERGLPMAPDPLTKEEQAIVQRAARFTPPPAAKQCFHDAQLLVLGDHTEQLQYAEGYAVGQAGFPCHHAWVTLNGKVVDRTWAALAESDDAPHGWKYRGAHFPRTVIRARILEASETRALIGDYTRDFPLLRTGRLEADNVTHIYA